MDFDGVLHSYSSPWVNAETIPDAPVPGAIDFLIEAQRFFNVAIYSSRSGQSGGIAAMQTWLRQAALEQYDDEVTDTLMQNIEWPTQKPPAFLTLDDRVMQFDGVWPTMPALLNFQPWNRK